jgi:hypothetical protein
VHYARMERFGIIILIFLLFIGGNMLYRAISFVMVPILTLALGTDGIAVFLQNT